MRIRSDAAGTPGTSAAGTRVPDTVQAPPQETSQVACPECFQLGQHLDGCPEARAPQATQNPHQVDKTNGAHALTHLPPAADVTRTYPAEMVVEGAHVVEVVWGKEYWQPIQFHGIEVGPFRATSAVRKGESEAQAVARVHEDLAATARIIRKQKITDYLDSLAQVSQGVAARPAR